MSDKKQWWIAIGIVVTSIILASVKKKQEEENDRATKQLMTQVTNIFVEAIPGPKF